MEIMNPLTIPLNDSCTHVSHIAKLGETRPACSWNWEVAIVGRPGIAV